MTNPIEQVDAALGWQRTGRMTEEQEMAMFLEVFFPSMSKKKKNEIMDEVRNAKHSIST